jgi:hypothetical protein
VSLTTILANIRGNIIDVPSATEDRLIGWINEAQRVAEAKHQWKGLQTTWVPITTAGSNSIATAAAPTVFKPADWIVAIGDPWYRTGDLGVTMRMEWLPSLQDARKDYAVDRSVNNRGDPEALLEDEDAITVYPVPDEGNSLGNYSAAGEYQIVIPYLKRAAVLTEGAPTNFFTEDGDLSLYLEEYASAKAMLFNRDVDNAGVSLTMSAGHMLRAKRLDKKRRSQFIKLTPRRDVHASRRQRRAF